MELRDYMSVRRAYNLVRRETPSTSRLTFEEYAILCHLENLGHELKTSEIADYQGVLRPTMTHRTNHLAQLGYIERHEGTTDRRNVCCSISAAGRVAADAISAAICDNIVAGQPLHRSTPERIAMVADSMGQVFCTAGDLVLLGLEHSEEGMSISDLVSELGLLQPTVSMSVSALVDVSFVSRVHSETGPHSTKIVLTPEGRGAVEPIEQHILSVVVRRRRTGSLDR